MPKGTRTSLGAVQDGPRRMARLVQPALALSVLAMLAACGQQATNRSVNGGVVTHGDYNRPASYDPPGPSSDPWGPYIKQAARRFDVPERWVREVMRQESAGRPGATSRVGAMGLMQVMPATYRELRGRYGLGADPYHPYDSIMAGTAYLREMYDLYGSPAFLAAYNAGPRRLEDYLWKSRGLPAETRNYVARIGPNIIAHSPSRRTAPEIYAAAEIPLQIPAGPRRMDSATMLALREQRQAVDPGIQMARLPTGPVVRMEPIPDGSTYAGSALVAPVQLASLGEGTVVRMDPIPDGSTGPAPSAAPAPAAPRPTSLVAAPIPLPAPARPRGLGLMGTANASALPASLRAGMARPAAASGGWAVQVGAFASQNLARNAATTARVAGGPAGQVMVQPVVAGRSTLYRARVTGLSQSAAQAVCDRLRRNGACMVLSPDAQG